MTSRKILLLENVAAQAAGVRERLAQAGLQVAVSRYEADGLKRLAEWSPDVVLLSMAHPAGDVAEHCRRVRGLAPGARLVLTSSLSRERLAQQHPALLELVDGVLLRPYSFEEVLEAIGPAPGRLAPAGDRGAAPAAEAAPGDLERLRADFQRQIEEKFLEVEELKRRLEAAGRREPASPGRPQQPDPENARLREALDAAEKRSALALAMERLKTSELEVKIENLLRMKDDFERRTQDQLDAGAEEVEQLRRELGELRGGGERDGAALAALREELERTLVDKEQVEERLHQLEARGDGGLAQRLAAAEAALAGATAEGQRLEALLERERADAARGAAEVAGLRAQAAEADHRLEELLVARAGLEEQARADAEDLARARAAAADAAARAAALEEEAGRHRAEAAEAQVQLATAAAAAARLEEELLREGGRREGLAAELERSAGDARVAREEAEAGERRAAELLARCEEAEARAKAADAARLALADEAEAAVAQVAGRARELEAELAAERARGTSAGTGEREAAAASAAELDRLRAEGAGLAAQLEGLRAEAAALAAERDRVRGEKAELAAERDRLRAEMAELAAARDGLRTEAAERAARVEAERRAASERLEQAERRVAELEHRAGALAAEAGRAQETLRAAARAEDEARRAAGQADEARARQADAETALAAERAAGRRLQAQLDEAQAAASALEARLAEALAAVPAPAAVPPGLDGELRRIQELLEEVVTRARDDAVEHARREAQLGVRLESALDERTHLQERFDRLLADASERERRSAALLQSAIERGATGPGAGERTNLPALIPADPSARAAGSRRLVVAAAAVLGAGVALALAVAGLRREAPAPPSPPAPVVAPAPAPEPEPREQRPPSPSAAWDRWTRSDGSGGVFVQATLRTEQQLRAEVDAEGRARGLDARAARAEVDRRLAGLRFGEAYYVTVYAKSLDPGRPAWLDDLAGRLRLGDGSGREAAAFVVPGRGRDLSVSSYGSGAPEDRLYEAKLTVGFPRAALSPSPRSLQLAVSAVGTASRRVLTWELE